MIVNDNAGLLFKTRCHDVFREQARSYSDLCVG
jgi:hypothetical protein